MLTAIVVLSLACASGSASDDDATRSAPSSGSLRHPSLPRVAQISAPPGRRMRPAVAVEFASGPGQQDLAGGLVLKLLELGHPVVSSRSRAKISIQTRMTNDGGARVVVQSATQSSVVEVDPGPFSVVALEAEAQTVAKLLTIRKGISPAATPLSPSVALSSEDVRPGSDRVRIQRVVALRLLRAGYAVSATKSDTAVTVCVVLRELDAIVAASGSTEEPCWARPRPPFVAAPNRIDRPEGNATAALVEKIATAAQLQADRALSPSEGYDLGQTKTTVPFGDKNTNAIGADTLGGGGDDESFVDQFAPRRAFVLGAAGLTARGRNADPSARIMFRTEHGRRLGLGVILDATSASDPNVFAAEFVGLVGLTYAIDMEFGFEAVLGAFGGGRAHIYNLQNPALVPPEGQARDGILGEFLVAAFMGIQYAITPTFSVVASILFTFGEERSYSTANLPLWARAAGGIGPSLGLSCQLPIFEGAPSARDDTARTDGGMRAGEPVDSAP